MNVAGQYFQKPIFQCPECVRSYKSPVRMANHYRDKHPEKDLRSPYARYPTSQVSFLLRISTETEMTSQIYFAIIMTKETKMTLPHLLEANILFCCRERNGSTVPQALLGHLMWTGTTLVMTMPTSTQQERKEKERSSQPTRTPHRLSIPTPATPL
jgi:hypothetical protein